MMNEHIHKAQRILKDRKFISTRSLARQMDITGQMAGKLLRELKWKRWNTDNMHVHRPTYVSPRSEIYHEL